jgi:hypothetical protein
MQKSIVLFLSVYIKTEESCLQNEAKPGINKKLTPAL